MSTVPLHDTPDTKERELLLRMADMEEYGVLGSKMESDSTNARFISEICIECCSRLPTPSRSKHWESDSAGDGLCPLWCRVTESLTGSLGGKSHQEALRKDGQVQ